MINKFNLDTVADPENMNMLIEGINKNEEDITAVKESVEEVGSAIGQLSNKSFIPRGDLSIVLGTKDLNQAKTEGGYLCVETETIKYINKPPLIGWFTLLIYLGGTGAVFQEAIQHDGPRTSRHYDGLNWSPWKEIATTDKVITTSPWEIPQKIDANNIRTTGIIVTSSYCTNVPGITGGYASTEGFLYTRKFNDAYIVQEFRSIYNNEPKWNRFLFFNNWTPWTTGSGGKQELEIPYNAGYLNNTTSRYNSKLVKNGLDQVIVYGAVKKADGSNFAAGLDTQIAIIPVGWKNSFNNRCGAVATELNGIPLGEARVAIFDGTIYVSASVSCPCIMFTIPYELLRY